MVSNFRETVIECHVQMMNREVRRDPGTLHADSQHLAVGARRVDQSFPGRFVALQTAVERVAVRIGNLVCETSTGTPRKVVLRS